MESSFIITLLALTIITFILITFVFTKKYQFLITCYSLGVKEETWKGVQIDTSTTVYFDEKGQVVDIRGRFVSKNLLKETE